MAESASQTEERPLHGEGSGAARSAGPILCGSTLLLVVGYVWQYWVAGSPLFSVLWMNADWSEASAQRADRILLAVLIAGGVGVAVRSRGAALGVAGILVLWTGLDMHSTESFWRWLPASRATRWAAPIAALLLWHLRPTAGTLLRWAAAATFCAHGVKALALYSPFLDLLFAAAGRVGLRLDPTAAEWLLQTIGAIDVVIAVLLVTTGWRRPGRLVFWIAVYMAVWGAITALSRVVHSGLGGVPNALIRAPNAGVPAALVALWWAEFRSSRATSE